VLSEHIFIGKRIDHYRVLAEISSSPLSSVYRAEHTLHTKSNVIIKLHHTAPLSEQKRHLFLQEVQLLKKIRHPHILPILDAGVYKGTPYLVTEYAARGSLRERINNLRPDHLLPIQETLTMLLQIGQALQYAHQLNTIHGNLKPENILFHQEHDALLADFCVVTLLNPASSNSTQHASIYPYMAPERFQSRVYKESDQYALGCIAYELLTGQVPFTAASLSGIQQKHITEKPVPLTQHNLLLPRSLEETVLKAMEKKSEDRYPSIKDFVSSLSTHTAGRSSTFKPSPRAISITSSPPLLSNSTTHTNTSNNDEPVEEKIDSDSDNHQFAQAPLALPAPAMRETQEIVAGVSSADDSHLQTSEAVQEITQKLDQFKSKDIEVLSPQSTNKAQKPLFLDSPLTQKVAFLAETTGKLAARLSPATRRSIGSNWNQRGSKSFRRNGFIFFVALWAVIVVAIYGLFTFGVPLTRPGSIPHAISQKIISTPTAGPAQTPISRPTVTSVPASKQASVTTPTPSPTPTPILTASPASFQIINDCLQEFNHYLCVVTLQLPSSYPDDLKWTTSSSGGTTSFSPNRGKLSPGQQQQVNVLLPATCPHSGSLFFTTEDGRTITIPWTC
jgi:serine/threonine protein kinase